MIALLLFLFILGLLIVVHEFGHFITAKRTGVKVESFSLGFGPQIFRKKKAGTEYSLNLIPLGGYVELAGDNMEAYKGGKDEYLSQPLSKRFQIIFAGPFLNYIMGFLCFWLIFFAGYPSLTTKVGGLLDGYGAQEAGLRVGDRIIAIDDKQVQYWEDLQALVQAKKDAASVRLRIIRDNKETDLTVIVKNKEVADISGTRRNVGLLGITPYDEIVQVKHGIGESFILSVKKVFDLTVITYKALWGMITGRLPLRESITGPLGMFYITSKVAKLGIIAILHFIAVLSVNLAIFNLLPLPVLDGGHIILLGVEKIRGRHLGIKAEEIITRIGLSLIITLAVLVTFNDIFRLSDKIMRFFGKWF